MPLTMFFFLKIVLVFSSPLWFHRNFKIFFFYISVKNAIGFFFLKFYFYFLQNKIHTSKHNYIRTDYYIMDLKKQIK